MTQERPIPPLSRDLSFWSMTVTQFLGAFNDNLFKQLILLLSVVAVAGSENTENVDLQGMAMIIFSCPFLLFSGFAGYLSDRYSKRHIVVLSKVAEIVVMLLGLFAFASYGSTGLVGTLCVLFLMGTQSAFFGPSKYGILPETLRRGDLSKANGIILMTTFIAIILGTAAAGELKHNITEVDQLWVISGVCVLIAIAGTLTSLAICRIPPAKPTLVFEPVSLAIPVDTVKVLLADRPMLLALFASCMFWLVGGMVHMSVNALGIRQLQLVDDVTSRMVSCMAIGITVGCLVAGSWSRGRFASRIVRMGLWGIFLCLLVLALPGGQYGHLLGFWGTVVVLILLGFFAGMFAVPLQVFLQTRSPEDQKGRMIATMNVANWIAILLSGVLYEIFGAVQNQMDWSPNTTFAFTAVLLAPVVLFYRPPAEML